VQNVLLPGEGCDRRWAADKKDFGAKICHLIINDIINEEGLGMNYSKQFIF